MPELTELQAELLKVLKDHSQKDMFSVTCDLTNKKLYNAMKTRPNHDDYITRILADLKRKNKIKTVRKQIMGKGLKRIITIL